MQRSSGQWALSKSWHILSRQHPGQPIESPLPEDGQQSIRHASNGQFDMEYIWQAIESTPASPIGSPTSGAAASPAGTN
jgi:hypothetical protein